MPPRRRALQYTGLVTAGLAGCLGDGSSEPTDRTPPGTTDATATGTTATPHPGRAPAHPGGAAIGDVGHYLSGETVCFAHNPDGREFTITLGRYDWPFEGSWNDPELGLTVEAPSGGEGVSTTATVETGPTEVTVPGGAAGTYRVDVDQGTTLNYYHLSTSLPRAVAWTGPGDGSAAQSPWFFSVPMVPRTWTFWVPDGTETFSITTQSNSFRTQREDGGLIVRSPRGQPKTALWRQPNPSVRDGELRAAPEKPDPPWNESRHVVVEPGADGRYWQLEVRMGGAHTYSDITVALDGVPPYLSSAPETWFHPEDGVPSPATYETEAFARADVPPADERDKPHWSYWPPSPSIGDPDGVHVRSPARIALWNPEGRDLDLTLGPYIARDGSPSADASVTLTSPDGDTAFEAQPPLDGRTLSFEGLAYLDVANYERFWAYTYPATPTVLVGQPGDGDWASHTLETGTIRHWFFHVPEGTDSFRLRYATAHPDDAVAIDVNAPDRTVERLYGDADEAEVSVPAGLDGRIWHLHTDVADAARYTQSGDQPRFASPTVTLDVAGVPPLLAPTWEQWFDPDAVESAD
jgi:hypothetical protein